MPFEPVILFFILGLFAGVIPSDLKIPGVLYESLSIFLLLAIGPKGGVELACYALADLVGPAHRRAPENRYYENYGMVTFLLDVQVIRHEKF